MMTFLSDVASVVGWVIIWFWILLATAALLASIADLQDDLTITLLGLVLILGSMLMTAAGLTALLYWVTP